MIFYEIGHSMKWFSMKKNSKKIFYEMAFYDLTWRLFFIEYSINPMLLDVGYDDGIV
jgi:hypothetical protein